MQVSRLVRLGVAPRLNPRYLFERALEYPSVAREDVGLEGLVVHVDHPDVLFAVEPRSVARRIGVGVAAEGALVHRALGDVRERRLLIDHLPHQVEPARSRRPVGGHLAEVPVLRHGFTLHPVPPRDLAEVRLGPRLPVHIHLSHRVPSIRSPFRAALERRMLRWLGWDRPIGAVLASGEFAIIFVLTKTPPSALRFSRLP